MNLASRQSAGDNSSVLHSCAANAPHARARPHDRAMKPLKKPTAVRVNNTTRWHYDSEEWVSLTRGSRSPITDQSLADRCAAIQISLNKPVVFSGPTAAELLELPLPAPLLYPKHRIETTLPMNSFHLRRNDVVCRRRDLRPPMTMRLGYLTVIAPAQLVVDLGRVLSLERLVAIGDEVLNRNLATREDLIRALAMSTKCRGVVRARQAIEMLDARAESPRESILRAYLVSAGIRVEVQRIITDGLGNFVARVDLAIEEEGIAIEYDGSHHLTREQQTKDALRRQRLEEAGWMVLTINADDLASRAKLIRRVTSAIHSRRHPLDR